MQVAVGAGGHRVTDGEGLATFAAEAERLGADALWTAESWAHDAATPLAYVAARTRRLRLVSNVLQVGTRTPALLAMTAMTLYTMSGGRFVLGLGVSGPRVLEGWHGVRFDRPLQRTRETVAICRAVFAGQPLRHAGEVYQVPLPPVDGAHGGDSGDPDGDPGGGSDGEPDDQARRSDAPPTPDLPIHLAALGPRNLRLTGELADGWIGTAFAPEHADTFLSPIRQGARAAGRDPAALEIAAGGQVRFTDDVAQAVDELRMQTAVVLGAMGSARHNFYADAYARQGWAEEVRTVRRLWRDGLPDEAAAAVPEELVRTTNLVGTPSMVRERVRALRAAGVTTLRAGLHGATVSQRLDTLGRLMDVVRAA